MKHARQLSLWSVAISRSDCPEPRCTRWQPEVGCPRKADGVRLHPQWCYDLDRVPRVHCLACGEPIGDEPYLLNTGLARFATMLFVHRRCAQEPEEHVEP